MVEDTAADKTTQARPKPPVGAVMVVGSGIAGMQAALDLAESGFKVYLVEDLTAIGGRMAQIDKTFPTNDCAMCIMSPKLVEVGRHKDIEILTTTEVESLDGSCGHFKAKLKRRPRYVRLDKCTGCGDCAAVCPVVLEDEHNLSMTDRHAIFKKYPQAIPGGFAIDKNGVSPCRFGCPAGVDAHAYVALIARGRFAEAMEVQRKENPFPAICGRICPHPCELQCARGRLDQPIAIAELKRFLADWEKAHPDEVPPPPEINARLEKVAIVGGGPAGLTAARQLRLEGYKVTVFEAMPKPGGMMRYQVPDYRLPPDLLDHEIETAVLDLGVELKTSSTVGNDVSIEQLRKEGYKAFLLAVGAQKSERPNIDGADQISKGFMDTADFLRGVNAGGDVEVKGKVAVSGTGPLAVDAARTALRRGADAVTVLCRRARGQIREELWEVEEAENEGIEFRFLTGVQKLYHESGTLAGLKCVETQSGRPDLSGRRRPIPVEGSEFTLDADLYIATATGKPELQPLAPEIESMVSPWGYLTADPVTLQTRSDDIFAAGEAVSGPATAIEAIEAGKRAAESIHRFLNKQDLRKGHMPPDWTQAEKDVKGLARQDRVRMQTLSAEERKGNFNEIAKGYNAEEAQAEAARCLDCATCCECMLCVDACKADAVFHDDVEETLNVDLGSVVLAPGFEVFPAGLRPEFGFGEYPNVITSLEFERLLSASGPTDGHVKRPSDGKEPVRVAWIQCVGSRDHLCNRDYCSSVCCMYASKEAITAKEHDNQIEPTVFFIDLRAFGKGFDDYVDRGRDHYGINYVRAMVSRVIEDPHTGDLEVRYVDPAGKRISEEFDMVVLSVGVQVSDRVKAMAERIGVDLDEFGFARTDGFTPLGTNRPGVFVCGAFAGPKDIPETVSEASGAAGAAASELAQSRGTLITEESYPPERVIPEGDPLRVGVFVCHCGINIAAVVDVEEVAAHAKQLPGVVFSDNVLYACSQDSQEKMREIIEEHKLNRVIVASCSPRTHEPLFQQTLSQAGLNKYLFDMANIRDQCSWVHRHDNARATEKATRLLRMALANVSQASPLVERDFDVDSNLLVIGGGLAGMTAALQAARQDFGVYLVEREPELGGNLRNLRRTVDGARIDTFLDRLRKDVNANPKIRVFTSSQVVEHSGYIGNFETEIMTPGGVSRKVKHGAVLIATGGREARPEIHGLGTDQRVLTQTDFEQRLEQEKDLGQRAKSVVMIQCAGSRDENQPYCSRICCNQAIKNALSFKQRFPESRVNILYQDIRSYGLTELNYRAARKAGINFIRCDPETNPPHINLETERMEITVQDPSIRRSVVLQPDLLVLSTGVQAHVNEELGTMFRVPRADTGFFIEAHAKLRPVDFASEGLFLAGVAHGPKNISETISQASAAVARAATILSQPKLCLSGVVSQVEPDHCAVCLTCVRACPYGVPVINEEHAAEINPALCQGCGICVAECPAKTITLGHFTDKQLLAKIDAIRKDDQTKEAP
jgi:heterodisulfide reductase subunit A-like polyferredoxin